MGPGRGVTIGQMMKLVAFGAAASMWLLPMRALVEEGVASWPVILASEAVAIPLAEAAAAFVLVRPGRFRDGLILAMVGTSLTVALAAGIYLLAWGAAMRGGATPNALVAAILALGIPTSAALFYILPGACPGCGRSMLLPGETFRRRPGSPLERAYRCDACGGRFRRRRGRWEPIPAEGDAGPGPSPREAGVG